MSSTSLLRTTIFASAALLGASLSAQTITWGPVQNATTPTDVSTKGTLVVAYNLHQYTVNAVVNGVTFVGGVGLDSGPRPSTWNGYNDLALSGGTTGDAEYDKLLNGSRVMSSVAPASNPTAIAGIRLDHPAIATLVAGKTYEIQVWFADQRRGADLIYDRKMEFNSAVGTPTLATPGINGGEITSLAGLTVGTASGHLDGDPNNSTAPGDTTFGSYCIGSFTYSGTETWLTVTGYHPDPTKTLRPHLNAYQIREVGIPGSFTYAGNTPGGCPSPAGQAQLSAATTPNIGNAAFAVDMAPIPPSLSYLLVGFSDTTWNAAALPLPVPISLFTSWAAPSCAVVVDPLTSVSMTAGAGSASWALPLPNWASLIGTKFFVQGIGLYPGPNMYTTGKGTIVIGQ